MFLRTASRIVKHTDHGSDNKVRRGNEERAVDERRTTADLVKEEEGHDDGNKLGNVEHAREGDLHFVVEAELLKEGGRVVDELVWSVCVYIY